LGLKDGIITVYALPGAWMYLLNVHLIQWNVASGNLQQEVTNKQTGSEDTEEKRAGLFEKIGS
jgi:hypothetical protein